MHLKNWPLRYPDGLHRALSPAYDLVCTAVYGSRPDKWYIGWPSRTRSNDVDRPFLPPVTADTAAVMFTADGAPRPRP